MSLSPPQAEQVVKSKKKAVGSFSNNGFQEAVRGKLEGCKDSLQCVIELGRLSQSSLNGIGRYNRELAMRSSNITSPNHNEGRDLYPINPTDAEIFVSALCPVVDLSIREGVAQLTLGMVRGLNFLTGVGWLDRPIFPRIVQLLSEAQKRSI